MRLSKSARRRREKTIPMVRGERLENITWDPQTKRVSFQVAGQERASHYWYTVSLTASELRSLVLAGFGERSTAEQRLWGRLFEVWEQSLSDDATT